MDATNATTFDKLSDMWLDTQILEDGTRREYRKAMGFWSGMFGDKPIAKITTMEVRQAIAQKAKDASAKTVNNLLIPLRGVFETAMADGLVTRNPCESIKNLKHQKPTPDPFTKSEMERIIEWLKRNTPPHVHSWYTVAFLTGLRPSEQRVIRQTDIDGDQIKIERAYVRQHLKRTKTYSVRQVDLSARPASATAH